ncbi:trehalose-phosphatase [Pseudooceanicola sp.]|uniref:trehalose-phosphatase n=1 Tax=Pseudooceanicola sp. TaxID=1914328 RepID=UPI0035C72D64
MPHIALPRDHDLLQLPMATDRRRAAPKVDWRTSAAFLSFEGALAPSRNKHGVIGLPGRERTLLHALSQRCGGAVAILAGQQLSDLRKLLSGPDVILSGSHGAEIDINGDPKIMPGADATIDRSYPEVKACAAAEGLTVQRRAASLAIPYKDCPEAGGRVVRLVETLARTCEGLAPRHGTWLSELIPRDYTKGTALFQIINHPGFAGRRPVAIGRDGTDESALRAARSIGGIGLRIGGGATEADYVFATQRDFISWLDRSLR